MSQAGVASRRAAEKLILDGRVRVNGRVVRELGTKVDPARDSVEVDGHKAQRETKQYWLLYKPRGYVTTRSDPDGRPTVMELLPSVDVRLYPVGRLDFNTEGLLLVTNDGDLANALMHPRGEVPKTYRVKLRGMVTQDAIDQWQSGVELDDGIRTAPADVAHLGDTERNSWVEITIREGRNRQIHRMAAAVGFEIAKLQRVRYGPLEVGRLRPGKYRELLPEEVRALRKACGLPTSTGGEGERSHGVGRDRGPARAGGDRGPGRAGGDRGPGRAGGDRRSRHKGPPPAPRKRSRTK